MLASHFSTFFEANPGLLHFCDHSHHPWPDATRAGHERYWRDSATLTGLPTSVRSARLFGSGEADVLDPGGKDAVAELEE